MIGIKDSILKLDKYFVSQMPVRVKLNQNESPLDIPVKIKEEIFKKLKETSWNRYPSTSPDSLVRKIGEYTDFSPSGILVGNGSNEMIQTLIFATCDSGDQILTLQPGFSVYKRVSSVMNIGFIEVSLKENFQFDVDSIIEKGQSAKLVILASPNNPTGTVLTLEEIEEISKHQDGLVAMDEAYYEFHQETAQELIEKLGNIVVIRTFSKALNLAGIRLGYMLGKERIIKELAKAKLPFSVGIFQQVVGEGILENINFFEESIKKIIKERARLFSELNKEKNLSPIPSKANFILFESKDFSGKDLYKRLYKKGVVLRRFDSPLLKNMLRVTVGKQEENDVFLQNLRDITTGEIS